MNRKSDTRQDAALSMSPDNAEYKRKATHIENILGHLIDHQHISGLEALKEYGCYRLAPVIYNLRNAGIEITTAREKHGGQNQGRHGRYHLESLEPAQAYMRSLVNKRPIGLS